MPVRHVIAPRLTPAHPGSPLLTPAPVPLLVVASHQTPFPDAFPDAFPDDRLTLQARSTRDQPHQQQYGAISVPIGRGCILTAPSQVSCLVPPARDEGCAYRPQNRWMCIAAKTPSMTMPTIDSAVASHDGTEFRWNWAKNTRPCTAFRLICSASNA